MISAAMASLDATPKPSHTTSSGAMAKTGSAWATTSRGPSACSVRRERAMSKATATPAAEPSTRPPSISPPVTSASGQIRPKSPTSVAATRDGAGSR